MPDDRSADVRARRRTPSGVPAPAGAGPRASDAGDRVSAPLADGSLRATAPLLEVEDLHVTFAARRRACSAGVERQRSLEPSTASNLRPGRGRDRGARRGVRLRQDYARPRDHGVRPARMPDGSCSRASRSGRDLRAYRRKVQMVYQDPTGSLNPRQTVYDSVAEAPPHPQDPGRRGGAGGRGALPRRAPPAGAVLPAVPARALRRPAAARGDRGRARAGAAGDRRRRAGLQPGRVSVRGEILRLLLHLRQTSRITHPDRDARPRARVDDRRPRRRDVPGPDRRAGADPRRAHRRRGTRTRARCSTSSPKRSGIDAPAAGRRAARPHAASPMDAGSIPGVRRWPMATPLPQASTARAARSIRL